MKRWRRPLILIALLLLAGAVVNVAVAWVLVGAPESWTRRGPRMDFVAVPPTWLHRGDFQGVVLREHGVGWTRAICEGGGEGSGLRNGARTLICVASGGPARCMLSTRMKRGWSDWSRPWAIKPPRRLLPGDGWFPSDRDHLPVIPIPAGFAINTLFYAAVVGVILALPLSFFPLRRRLRARRGRCPKCGYDLAGLAPAIACPECGVSGGG